jgi:hypothetical protein
MISHESSLAASQASLNEIVAGMIRGMSGYRERIGWALKALREHTWAAGFAFEGVPPKDDEWARAHPGEMAILATRVLEAAKEADTARARAASITLRLGYLLNRSGIGSCSWRPPVLDGRFAAGRSRVGG